MSCHVIMSCQVGVGILLVYTAGAALYWRYTATLPLAVYLLLAAGVPSSHHLSWPTLATYLYLRRSPLCARVPHLAAWTQGGGGGGLGAQVAQVRRREDLKLSKLTPQYLLELETKVKNEGSRRFHNWSDWLA